VFLRPTPLSRRRSLALALAGAATLPLALAVAAPAGVAGGPSGGRVFVADRAGGTVSVIRVRDDQVTSTLSLPAAAAPAEPMYVVYSPNVDRVFVGDRANDRVVAFHADTLAFDGEAKAGAGVFHMWADASNKQLWVNNDVDLTTSVIDVETLATIATVPTPADLVALGGKPHDVIVDGDQAFVTVNGVTGPDDYVVRFSTTTFQETGRAPVGDDAHLSVNASDLLYVPCQAANAVYVLDRGDLSLVKIIDVPGAHGAGMMDSGRVFYTTNLPGGGTGALHAIDTSGLQTIGTPVDAPYATPHNVALTPNGRKLYLTHSGATADKVTIYRIASDATPVFAGEVTVGLNPFGLDYVP